jgi:ABC-2 type transport system permease protein
MDRRRFVSALPALAAGPYLGVTLGATLSAALSGCSSEPLTGPVDIKWDRDVCVRCSMVISDRHFAAQIRNPMKKVLKFDDFGCAVFWKEHMKQLWLTAKLDIVESLRARWFQIYTLVFGGIVALLFLFGLTESRVLGFIGLSRLLVTYIQLTMAILPIFVLITTVRSVAGDREAGVFEYLLSLPVSLAAWFWGKILGRYIVIFLPVFAAMARAVCWALCRASRCRGACSATTPRCWRRWRLCFLGIGMLISALARSTDMAQGAAFMVWLTLLLFLDLILLGVMIQGKVAPEVAVTHRAGQPAAGVPHRRAGAVRPAADRARPLGLRHPRPVREIPDLVEMDAKYRSKGLLILGLAIEDAEYREAVRDFAKAYGVDYRVLLASVGKGVELMKALGNDKAGLPFTVVIDRNGKIVSRKLGAMSKAEMEAAIKQVL